MSYLKKTLSPGEEILAHFTLHWSQIITPVFVLLIAAGMWFDGWYLAIVVSLAVWAVYMLLDIWSVEQGITTRRVVFKRGIIGRHTEELLITALETVELRQSIPERLLGSGTIICTGRGSAEVSFKNMEEPLWVKQMIESALNQDGSR